MASAESRRVGAESGWGRNWDREGKTQTGRVGVGRARDREGGSREGKGQGGSGKVPPHLRLMAWE